MKLNATMPSLYPRHSHLQKHRTIALYFPWAKDRNFIMKTGKATFQIWVYFAKQY